VFEYTLSIFILEGSIFFEKYVPTYNGAEAGEVPISTHMPFLAVKMAWLLAFPDASLKFL
jgi:hypothetical protein